MQAGRDLHDRALSACVHILSERSLRAVEPYHILSRDIGGRVLSVIMGRKVMQRSSEYGGMVQVADGKQQPQHRSMASWPRQSPSQTSTSL